MKFDAIASERRRVRTKSALQAKRRTSTSTTPWEERIVQAKELTTVQRADDGTEAFAARANAAYLDWLEQRTARIEELRARIETGTYHVDSITLVEDMVRKGTF